MKQSDWKYRLSFWTEKSINCLGNEPRKKVASWVLVARRSRWRPGVDTERVGGYLAGVAEEQWWWGTYIPPRHCSVVFAKNKVLFGCRGTNPPVELIHPRLGCLLTCQLILVGGDSLPLPTLQSPLVSSIWLIPDTEQVQAFDLIIWENDYPRHFTTIAATLSSLSDESNFATLAAVIR